MRVRGAAPGICVSMTHEGIWIAEACGVAISHVSCSLLLLLLEYLSREKGIVRVPMELVFLDSVSQRDVSLYESVDGDDI